MYCHCLEPFLTTAVRFTFSVTLRPVSVMAVPPKYTLKHVSYGIDVHLLQRVDYVLHFK